MNKFSTFLCAIRAYSLPMSILNWLIIFLWSLKQGGNVTFGLIAFLAIFSAHIGVNLFDDVIDYYSNTPKQSCKLEYLKSGISIKTIFLLSLFFFSITLLCGIFFFLKLGINILIIAFFTAIICLLYPKLNYFALGEIAVGLNFGILLFLGVNYVMLFTFDYKAIILSIPIGILTVVVLMVHSFMDYDFDIKSGKKTLCTILKSKQKSLSLIFTIISIAYISLFLIIWLKILNWYVLFCFLTLPYSIFLYKKLKKYISYNEKSDFLINFKLARNLSLTFNLIIIISILIG